MGIRRFAALAVCASGLAAGMPAEAASPDFTLQDLNEKKFTLSSFRGKTPVLLAFYASWCPYCRQELPKVVAFRGQISDEKFTILGINIDEDRETAARFAESKGVNFPTLLDRDSTAATRFGASGIPYFVLIDREGNVESVGHKITNSLLKKARELSEFEN